MIASVVAALRGRRLAERRHAVGHRLDAGQGDGAGRERPQEHHDAQRLAALGQLLGLLGQRVQRDRAEVLDEDAVAADDDQQHQHHDVEVRRRGEQRARLLEAAQVGHRHHGDHQQAQRHAPLGVEVERRLDGQHAAGHGHGDGEDVVGHQRRPGDERRHLAEVLPRHDVGAATRRVGVDRLAVRQHDDDQQDRHDDGDRDELAEGGDADAGLGHEHEHDLVRGVGRRRDGVGGEDRQGDALAQPLVALLGRGDGAARGGSAWRATPRSRTVGAGPPSVPHAARRDAPLVHSATVHVVVVGCGRVGSSLARALIAEGHTVAVIDRRGDAFTRLGPDFAGTHGAGHRLRPRPPDRGRRRARPARWPR